jgi:ATP-binding cassette subfamily C protein
MRASAALAPKNEYCNDDVPITQIGFDLVREHVVTVLQHPILFNDSIRENLALGKQVSDQELWHAVLIARIASD